MLGQRVDVYVGDEWYPSDPAGGNESAPAAYRDSIDDAPGTPNPLLGVLILLSAACVAIALGCLIVATVWSAFH